ncbi:MAG: hypothetical protein J6T96_11325 [Bacteroidales bacterium]|nr:hypothetical protein [Bacteroidales bacterium]
MRRISYILSILAVLIWCCDGCSNPERRGGRGRQVNQEQTETAESEDESSESDEITEPTTDSSTEESSPEGAEPTITTFNVKLYIENSGSMDGYIDGSPDFKNALHSYMSDIQLSGIAENISLHFINDKIVNKGCDITNYFKSLSVTTLKQSGGDRNSTDISQVVKNVLDNSQNDDVSMIVSDFIFSPGKQDAAKYLQEQEIVIKGIFAQYMAKNPNCAVMFFQLTSLFKGTYYNRTNAKTQLKDVERPFYILIVGDKNALKQIRDKIPETNIKGSGVKNYFIMENDFLTPDYAVKNGSGNFKRSRNNPKHGISEAAKDRDGNMNFTVDVNFSKSLLDDDYISTVENYIISDKDFALTISKAVSNQYGYTHSLKFSSPYVKKNTLTIKIAKNIPQWISDFNDDNGLDINSTLSKTYGLKTIVGGIFEAFSYKQKYYTELSIDVNK